MSGVCIAGTGNTFVQITGNGNTVVAGHAYLTLTRFVARRQIRQDLDRLSPYTLSTPLLGREAESASLHTFLNDPRSILARVLIGGGGSGKTRLALELCEKIAGGWNAGFVTRTELRRFFAEQNLSDWGWQKPTLIVVDYAAEHAELLRDWLDELTDRTTEPAHVLRLLLLERHASTETGWWATVFASGGFRAASKRSVLDPPEPVPMRPLVAGDDRLALLKHMLKQASSGPPISTPTDDAALREKLMQLAWGGDPLFVMMAALAMVKLGHTKALSLNRVDLADELAGREADRLKELARSRSLDPALVQHLAACVTLAQGVAREDFEGFAANEKIAIHRPGGGDAAELADVLEEALPRANGIAPILPDLIGGALVLRILRRDARGATVLRCHAAFGRPVIESVIRCAQDFAESSRAPLQWLHRIVDELSENETELASLEASMPIESVVLRDLNLQVAEQLYFLCIAREDGAPDRLAAALHGLAVARAMAGRPEDALQNAQDAVDLYRALAKEQPVVLRPNLAMSLNSLATRLSELGRRESALPVAQEAVALYRALDVEQPDAFRAGLAMSVNNLANRLAELEMREPALQFAREAADKYRALDVDRPDVFRPDLAMALNNLSNRLAESGEFEPAWERAREAVNIRRTLAAELPDEFRPDLAISLHTLSNRLAELGRRAPALQTAQEAVEIYRKLSAGQPDVFRPHLASSLIVLSLRAREVHGAVSAVPIAREAVVALAAVFLQHPGAHSRWMNQIVGDYRQICAAAGQEPDAELLAPLIPHLSDKE
ncbi:MULTISPECIES: tetratricopeptide repeat protein [Paraburkholderia]|uniref:tetratricopeptide repeat protein n=1 Tax=Paraburkholderia TaxID=1822464 RepID=UPI002AB6B91D|nr:MULTISPECIES: tetratricopeptide repeat protein [Paraburkholderia]